MLVTILMPAFNEEDIIERNVMAWHDEVVRKLPGAEILVVDDRSTDGTGRVLREMAARRAGIRVVQPVRNGGHGKAVRFGFANATGEWVFQTDSDGQHLPAEFWKFWERRESSDFVMGVRGGRADGPVRVVITTTMRTLNFLLWGAWVRDANCPFKLMRRSALERVLVHIPGDCFIPMVLVSILSRKMGFRVTDVPVTHLARSGGTQSLKGLWRWVKVGTKCAGQLAGVRLRFRA